MSQINAIKIRPDIEKIVSQSDMDFQKWYSERREATERILRDYELFSSIPHLAYETDERDMKAITAVRNQIDALKEGLEYLDTIRKVRDGYRPKTE
jgi:hypothetical protein